MEDFSDKKYRGEWKFINPTGQITEHGYYYEKFKMQLPKNRGGRAKKRRGSAWKGLGKREPDWTPWIGCYWLKELHPGKAYMIRAAVAHTLLNDSWPVKKGIAIHLDGNSPLHIPE